MEFRSPETYMKAGHAWQPSYNPSPGMWKQGSLRSKPTSNSSRTDEPWFFLLRDTASKNKVKEGWRMSSSINLVLHVHVNTTAYAYTTHVCKHMLVHATHEKWERRKNIPVPCCNNRWLQPHCCPASSPPHCYFWIFKQLHPCAL